MTDDLLILRPAAEVATKSRRTRRRFERVLRANLAAALDEAGLAHDMRQDFGRLYLRTEADPALAVVTRVFGIGTVSRVEAECAPELDAIVAAGVRAFAERIRGRTYAVRARRLAPHPFHGQGVNERLGAALNPGARVDLDAPEVTVRAEIGAEVCHLFAEHRSGAGGLPVGTSGRVVTLLSGGFDSAVAAWRMLRRGAAVDYVLCNLGGSAQERLVLQVAKVLNDVWGHGHAARLFVVDFTATMADLRRAVRPDYIQIVLKRRMVRAACAIAYSRGADAIVTGEAVGQVSSQTLSNLRSIEPAATLPVLRPLIGFDKQEIVDEAQRVGTAALSRRIKEYCAIAAGRPATASRPGRVRYEEDKMDPAVLDGAVADRREIDLGAVSSADLKSEYLFTHTIPAGATIIDCQPPARHRDWHVPGAENRDPLELMDGLRGLDKGGTYVLYCTHGVQSAGAAEVLQQAGFEAYAFAGGIHALRRLVEETAA